MLSYNDLINIIKSIKSNVVLTKEHISISYDDMVIHVTNNNVWESMYCSYTVFYKNKIIMQGDVIGSYAEMILCVVSESAYKTISRKQILEFFGV